MVRRISRINHSLRRKRRSITMRKRSKRYDAFIKDQLRSLQAVDRAVGAIVDELEQQGRLRQTVFFFTSDNGYMWGEHKRWQKDKPYEEATRVPFVMVMPGIEPRSDDHLVVPSLDIPATIFELAGIKGRTEGLSLVPVLGNPSAPWRDHFLIEHYEGGIGGIFTGLRTKQVGKEWKYIEYATGDKELYDLVTDPYEEENRAQDGSYESIVDVLSASLEKLRGLAILDDKVPAAVIGRHYTFLIRAWGGKKPYAWSVIDGELPEGLKLDTQSGLISGIPVQMGRWDVSIKLEDSSVARHTGKHQSFIQQFTLSVGN